MAMQVGLMGLPQATPLRMRLRQRTPSPTETAVSFLNPHQQKNPSIDPALWQQMQAANRKWNKKTGIIFLVFVAAFFLCVMENSSIAALRDWMAAYIPTINKLVQHPTAIGLLPADYFATLSVLIPMGAIWIIWGEDVIARTRYGQQRLRQGPVKSAIFFYILPALFAIFVLFIAIAAPFSLPETPFTFGHKVFFLMLNSSIGLLAIGSLAGIFVMYCGVGLSILLFLPFAHLHSAIRKGN
jgi:hypothetical protein